MSRRTTTIDSQLYDVLKVSAGYEGRFVNDILDDLVRAYLDHNKDRIVKIIDDFWEDNSEPTIRKQGQSTILSYKSHDKYITTRKLRI